MGRSFPNLYAMEKTLKKVPGVVDAEAYVFYGDNSAFYLTADLKLTEEAAAKRAEAIAKATEEAKAAQAPDADAAQAAQDLQAAVAAADPFSVEKMAALCQTKIGAANGPQLIKIV